MSDQPDDWDPEAMPPGSDQYGLHDAMRATCPVAYSERLGWSVFRHADVMRVLHDPATFSNVVSAHVSIPDGMDAPEHTFYRALIDPYFSAERTAALEVPCRNIAGALIDEAIRQRSVEVMSAIAEPFAAAVLGAFMGWPPSITKWLTTWARRQQVATRTHDRAALADIAAEFDSLIAAVLNERRALGDHAPDDATTSLLRERVDGRALRDEEVAGVVRNWVAGEVGTVAAAAGIILRDLARRPEQQAVLRASPDQIPLAVEELLRTHGPLVTNRRLATRAVDLGGRHLEAGDRVALMWLAADRDPDVFADPTAVVLDRDQSRSLLYGAGIHACPGAPLARLALRVLTEETLLRARAVSPDREEEMAKFPAAGWTRSQLQLSRNLGNGHQ